MWFRYIELRHSGLQNPAGDNISDEQSQKDPAERTNQSS
jgi:hypothetical protein